MIKKQHKQAEKENEMFDIFNNAYIEDLEKLKETLKNKSKERVSLSDRLHQLFGYRKGKRK